MRVALMTLYPTDDAGIRGGVRAVTFNLVRGLRDYPDLDIHVVHCHSDVAVDRVVRDGNVTVHYLAQPRKHIVPNLIRAVGRVRGKLRELEPDVVNSHLSHFTVAAMSEYPTVWTVHGIAFQEARVYSRRLSDRLRYQLISHYERRALDGVTDIIAISPYVMDEYQGRTRARWHRIDNPIPDSFFSIPNREIPNRILFAGSIDERKNVLDLLRALTWVREQFPDVELHLAGWVNSPAYERVLQDYIQRHGLGRNVVFRGLLNRQQIQDAYSECALVALTSLQETQPMAVIEGMAAGKSVVATRVGGVSDLIDHGNTGFIVEPGDVKALVQCITSILNDGESRRRIGRAAREVASARFRIGVVASKYMRIYESVLLKASR